MPSYVFMLLCSRPNATSPCPVHNVFSKWLNYDEITLFH